MPLEDEMQHAVFGLSAMLIGVSSKYTPSVALDFEATTHQLV